MFADPSLPGRHEAVPFAPRVDRDMRNPVATSSDRTYGRSVNAAVAGVSGPTHNSDHSRCAPRMAGAKEVSLEERVVAAIAVALSSSVRWVVCSDVHEDARRGLLRL